MYNAVDKIIYIFIWIHISLYSHENLTGLPNSFFTPERKSLLSTKYISGSVTAERADKTKESRIRLETSGYSKRFKTSCVKPIWKMQCFIYTNNKDFILDNFFTPNVRKKTHFLQQSLKSGNEKVHCFANYI